MATPDGEHAPPKTATRRRVATHPDGVNSAPAANRSRPVDDTTLLQRIGAGDERALAALYDRYAGLVFAVCMRILNNHMDAEEALIDTFWRIWDRPHQYDETRGSVAGYLLMLARSRAIDRRRARGAGPRNASTGVPDELLQQDGAGQTSAADAPLTPFENALGDEQHRRVRDALSRLSDAQREAIELSFFAGLTHAEIARRLDAPLGTIKTRIRQGLIQLRSEFRNPGGGTEP